MPVMSAPEIGRIVKLIHAEFREMPGMRLTEAQVRRLWNLTASECESALEHLVDDGHLVRDPTGRYAGSPYDHY